jgi:alpha-ketoglutarate-dependent taurine dioxygenase
VKKIILNKKKENLIRLVVSKKKSQKIFLNKKKTILLINEIKEKLLKKNYNYLLIKNLLISNKNIKDDLVSLSNLFGKIAPQNAKKEKLLNITPGKTPKTLDKLARYHQTNKGGSFHSDGPQLNKNPSILFMGCQKNTRKGGETVLVDIDKIFKYLKKNKKKTYFELMNKFLFERRGFKKNSILKKPIFEKTKNYINFRYLREYIEQGYRIKKLKISADKIDALNILDNQMSKNKNQKIEKLNEGDVIIINNHRTAHGRKTFKIDENEPRSIFRTWIK